MYGSSQVTVRDNAIRLNGVPIQEDAWVGEFIRRVDSFPMNVEIPGVTAAALLGD
jgi:hypothetical protein